MILLAVLLYFSLGKSLQDSVRKNSFSRLLNSDKPIGLTFEQREEIACQISKEVQISNESVLTSNGRYCGQKDEGGISTSNENCEFDYRMTQDEFYDYWVILPDLYANESNMEKTVQILESKPFEEAISNTINNNTELFGTDLKVKDISPAVIQANEIPAIPIIDAPEYIVKSNEIIFFFNGANNSNGYICGGISNNHTQVPVKQQVQHSLNYSFVFYAKNFLTKNMLQNITVTGLSKCTEYHYYWVMTNEDPNTYSYSTDVQEEMFKTKCFAQIIIIKRIQFALLLIFAYFFEF